MNESLKDVLSLLGSIASIAGLIITIVVAINVRRLRSFYQLKVRGPQLLGQISAKASTISTLAADFSNSRDQILSEFRQIGVLVEFLASKSPGATRGVANKLVKRIRRSQILARSDVTVLYADTQALLIAYDEIRRDLEWER